MCPVCGAEAEYFKELESFFEETSPGTERTVIIIGNGAAGVEAARAIRDRNRKIRIIIFAREKHPFYSRIHLSSFIAEDSLPAQIEIFPPSWYIENDIMVKAGLTVRRIMPDRHCVIDDGGNEHAYDRLIIATGAKPFRPAVEGLGKEGVFTLRNLDDALKIRSWARKSRSAVVLGGGILGVEAASSLLRMGLDVTVVELGDHFLPLQLDRAGGKVLQSILEKRGMRFFLNSTIKRFTGRKTLDAVELNNSRTLPADMAIISVGIIPDITLAQEAGIQVNKGILVNSRMETSVGDIYAAGDVAEFDGSVSGIWPAAVEQGTTAGLSAADVNTDYKGTLPVHILKVSGIDLTTVGKRYSGSPEQEEIVLSDPENGTYVKLVHNKQYLLGAITLGVRGIGFRLEKIIRQCQNISHILPELEKGNWGVLRKKPVRGREGPVRPADGK